LAGDQLADIVTAYTKRRLTMKPADALARSQPLEPNAKPLQSPCLPLN
jgi:hypothetical protein